MDCLTYLSILLGTTDSAFPYYAAVHLAFAMLFARLARIRSMTYTKQYWEAQVTDHNPLKRLGGRGIILFQRQSRLPLERLRRRVLLMYALTYIFVIVGGLTLVFVIRWGPR